MFSKKQDSENVDLMIIEFSPEKIMAGYSDCFYYWNEHWEEQVKFIKQMMEQRKWDIIKNIWKQIEDGKLIQIEPIMFSDNFEEAEYTGKFIIRARTLAVDKELLEYFSLDKIKSIWYGKGKSVSQITMRMSQEVRIPKW